MKNIFLIISAFVIFASVKSHAVLRVIDADGFKRVTSGSAVVILPIVSGTLGTLAGTETLLNKTLTLPILTGPVVSGGTFTNPSLTAPTIIGGSASGITSTNPTIIGGSASGVTIFNPTIIGGSISGTTGVGGGSSSAYVSDPLFENLITNPFFETSATTNWISSGTSVVQGTYTNPSAGNTKYAEITANVTNGAFISNTFVIPSFLASSTLNIPFTYRVVSGTWVAALTVSGSVVASQSVTTATSGNLFVSSFPMYHKINGTAGRNATFSLTAAASSSVAYLDNVSVAKEVKGTFLARYVAYRSSDATIIGGLGTTFNPDVVVFDNTGGRNFVPVSLNAVQIRKAGLYRVTSKNSFQSSNSANTSLQLVIDHQNSNLVVINSYTHNDLYNSNSNQLSTFSTSIVIDVSANDVVNFRFPTTGTTFTIKAGPLQHHIEIQELSRDTQ